MGANFLRPCCAPSWLLSAGCWLAFIAPRMAQGQDPPPTAEPCSHRVVVRLSDQLLNSLMTKGFSRETEVRDVILGTQIYGQARIDATPGVTLAECPDQATFQVTVEGTAHSRSIGYNGPAIIYSRSVTTFTATKQVVFEPGRGFYALPPKVLARTQTFTDGVGSSRGGIVGRVVRRKAGQQVAARHAESQEIARQKAEQRIALAFDRHMEQRLARLNRAAEFRSLVIATLRPAGSGEPKYACCSTPKYLQIATNFGDGGPAIELPVKGPLSAAAAPVEVWIHQSLVSGRLGVALELLSSQAGANDLLLALAAAARVIERQNGKASRPLAALAGNWPVKVNQLGEWSVVEVAFNPDDQSTATRLTAIPRR